MYNKDLSQDTLTQSIKRRIKHVMVQLLNEFDDRFPELGEHQNGKLFKFDIKNQFNDAIRATSDELRDYDISYRPIRINPDNTLSVTKAFMEAISSITFDEKPGMKITAQNNEQNLHVLQAIRLELNGGLVYVGKDGNLQFYICGMDHCINSVIPFMDLYRLLTNIQTEYMNWRNKIILKYVN